ncbi:MAG: hypothetical protein ACN4GW_19910, partial [Desulforhopalus sp.]
MKSHLNLSDLQLIVDNLSGVLQEIVDNSQTRHFIDKPHKKITVDDYKEAEENLSIFTRIGLTEQYSHFQSWFCKDNGFPHKQESKPLNRSKFHQLYDHADPATREILLPLVQTDLLLYNSVKETFHSGSQEF